MISKSKSLIMFSVFLFFYVFISCKDTPTENDSLFSTKRVYNIQSHLISDSELTIVQGLFQKNNLSLSNLQVYRLDFNNGCYYVRCYQFYNGLKLFTNDVVFSFNKQDIIVSIMNDLVTDITIDAKQNVSEKDAGNLFYEEILKDQQYKNQLNSYSKVGFNAELGFYDLNAGQSYALNHFVLAWKLNIANGSEYPFAYIRADTLRLIYYTNGIIIG